MAIRLGARFERRDDAGLREARARFGEGIAEGVADGLLERILAACGGGHNDIVPTFSAMAPSGLGGAIPPVGTRRAALVGPYPPVEPLPSNQRDRRGGPPQTLLTPIRPGWRLFSGPQSGGAPCGVCWYLRPSCAPRRSRARPPPRRGPIRVRCSTGSAPRRASLSGAVSGRAHARCSYNRPSSARSSSPARTSIRSSPTTT